MLFRFEIYAPTLALVIGALLVLLIVHLLLPQKSLNLPPFPGRPLPLVGHLHYLGGDARQKFMDFRNMAGEIYSMYFGSNLVVFLSGYDVLKEAVVKQADIFSDRPRGGAALILDSTYGIISSSGSPWKKNRTTFLQILKEFFQGRDVMSDKIMDEVRIYLDDLSSLEEKAADIHDLTSCALFNITFNFLHGRRFSSTDPFFLDFIHVVDEFMSLLAGGSLHQWYPSLRYLPGDLFKAKLLLKRHAEIMEKVRRLIKIVKDRDSDDVADCNMIASYLEKMSEAEALGQATELSEIELEWVVMDVMVGGSDTPAATLGWFYLFMVQHPEVQQKVFEDIATNVGLDRAPSSVDKSKLNYVNAAILETQRLGSISPMGIFHRCSEDTRVGGYDIPKDAYVVLHLDSILSDEKLWEKPQDFRPERFLKDGKLHCPEYFVPFGLGKRVCPGESLGRMELFLFVVSVIQRFQIVAADPTILPSREPRMGAVCPPLPYNVRFVKRDTE